MTTDRGVMRSSNLASKGQVTAGDGWTMQWDLSDPECQEARFIGPGGVRSEIISGQIDEAWLKRERARFLKDHSAQQAPLWEAALWETTT